MEKLEVRDSGGQVSSSGGAKKKRKRRHTSRLWDDVRKIECRGTLEWDKRKNYWWCRRCGYVYYGD